MNMPSGMQCILGVVAVFQLLVHGMQSMWCIWSTEKQPEKTAYLCQGICMKHQLLWRCLGRLHPRIAIRRWKRGLYCDTLFRRLPLKMHHKFLHMHVRALMAVCTLVRNDDATCVHILQEEFVKASRQWGRPFVQHKRRILAAYANEVATVLDRAVPIRDTAIEFLITCVSESSVPTACRERIATALKPQLGHPGGQNEYHVAYLLGTLAKADTTLRRDLLQMASQSQAGLP